LFNPLVVRRFAPKNKWILIHNSLLRARSVRHNDWINVKIITPEYEGDRRIEGHYEERLVPSGHWQEYEEKTWIPEHYE
jgi:hypothetical protein